MRSRRGARFLFASTSSTAEGGNPAFLPIRLYTAALCPDEDRILRLVIDVNVILHRPALPVARMDGQSDRPTITRHASCDETILPIL